MTKRGLRKISGKNAPKDQYKYCYDFYVNTQQKSLLGIYNR